MSIDKKELNDADSKNSKDENTKNMEAKSQDNKANSTTAKKILKLEEDKKAKIRAALEKIRAKKAASASIVKKEDDVKSNLLKREEKAEKVSLEEKKEKKPLQEEKNLQPKVKQDEKKEIKEEKKDVSDAKTKVEKKDVSEIPEKKSSFETYEIKDGKPVSLKSNVKSTFQSQKTTKKTLVKEQNEPVGEKKEPQKQEVKEEIPQKKEELPETKKEEIKLPELKKLQVSSQPTVRELAEKMGIKAVDLIKKLMSMGVYATITQRLDPDVAALVAIDYGYDLEMVSLFADEKLEEQKEEDDPKDLQPRPPVITIMGHVDHGKTTLLDAIRLSNVVDTEAGQITQHIGAYTVKTPKGYITVLDTPGHEAFTAMRAQGVKVTDIVVLVVSAADGVMPQTVEAINHAKAANVPIIVAINKIDLPTANPQNIKQQLSAYDLIPEDWGGKTPMVEISAKKKINIDKLLEIIHLQAEIMELKANPNRKGYGIVIEAKKDPKKGILATVICTKGTIKVGDPFICGTSYGKVRALINDRGERLDKITPSFPAEVLGITGDVPIAGDVFKVVDSEKEARNIAETRKIHKKQEDLIHQKNVSLLSLKSQVDQKMLKTLNIILKTDVYGSMQAIRDSLEKLSNPEVAIHILHSGIGNVTESDLMLAKASNAIIFGFNIGVSDEIKQEAEKSGVEIRIYKIIYDLFDELKAAMAGLLEPEIVETYVGSAQVLQVFDLSSGKVAGCIVKDGKVVRNGIVKIVREDKEIGTAKIIGLKRFKEDVKEVEKGFECGIQLEDFKDYKVGDILNIYIKEQKLRRLDV